MNKALQMVLKKFGLRSAVGTRNDTCREEWLQQTLTAIPAGARILDAGAGELSKKKYCAHLNYVSQDFGKYDGMGDGAGLQTVEWDQSRLDIICDIEDIPEDDASFDAIMCVEVLEHLPAPLKALGEFSRLLKTGGILIVTAPFCSLTHFAPFHFHSGFNSYFYERHLPELGFEIAELVPNGNFFEYVAQEVRRTFGDMSPFTDARPNLLEKIAGLYYLRMLGRMSSDDRESHKLLCYGYQLVAKKVGQK